jgi:hypothetical protein
VDWLKVGAALVCGVMEFVKSMRDEVTFAEVADRAVQYIREAKDEHAAAEAAEDAVFSGPANNLGR